MAYINGDDDEVSYRADGKSIARAATRTIVALITLASQGWAQGVGMTMPVTAPPDACHLNINVSGGGSFTVPSTPSLLLPVDEYNVTPSWAQDEPNGSSQSNPSAVSGLCQPSWNSCPATGSISEQDGRLTPFLRGYAASQDAKYILLGALWTELGQTVPGNPNISTCGSSSVSNSDCAKAL
jgi:hypothetical protein